MIRTLAPRQRAIRALHVLAGGLLLASVRAARATSFAPALRDEKPVRVWVTTPYLFKQPPPTLDTAPKAR